MEKELQLQLKKLMQAANISQYRLAQLSGVPQPSINHILTGRRTPKYATLNKLAAALNVPINALIGEADDKEFDKLAEFYSQKETVKIAQILPKIKDCILEAIFNLELDDLTNKHKAKIYNQICENLDKLK